jgi:hypothetical protein
MVKGVGEKKQLQRNKTFISEALLPAFDGKALTVHS